MKTYNEIPQEWRDRIEKLLLSVEGGKYPSKEVYAVHNYLFNLNEESSTCGSCLRRRGQAIKAKIAELKQNEEIKELPVQPQNVTTETVVEVLKPDWENLVRNLSEEAGMNLRPFVMGAVQNGFVPLTMNRRENNIIRRFRKEILDLAALYK